MSDIKINTATGDIELTGNDFELTTGREAIEQHLAQRLKTFINEWFLDLRIGIPYFEHIFKKRFDPVIVDSVLKREIIRTPGSIELLRFNADVDSGRTLNVEFKLKTTEGVINFSEEIP